MIDSTHVQLDFRLECSAARVKFRAFVPQNHAKAWDTPRSFYIAGSGPFCGVSACSVVVPCMFRSFRVSPTSVLWWWFFFFFISFYFLYLVYIIVIAHYRVQYGAITILIIRVKIFFSHKTSIKTKGFYWLLSQRKLWRKLCLLTTH